MRLSLILYYTALYYDNVDLLHELLKENANFETICYSINLQYLDKSISSKFDRRQYIEMIKTCGDIFVNFAQSIQYLSEEEKEQYIERFSKIIVDKYEQICNEIKEKPYHRLSFNCAFTKSCLDIFTDETYKQATSQQLEMINLCNMKKYSEETCQRLNNLMITKVFSKYLYNYDLMMQLYTDEQLEILPNSISYAISNFSNSEASLNKIIDFIQRRPDLAGSIVCISKERFMKIDNFTLIEIFNSRSRHYNDDTIDKIMRKKSAIKKLFGAYKKIDTQEQSGPVLTKKKELPSK